MLTSLAAAMTVTGLVTTTSATTMDTTTSVPTQTTIAPSTTVAPRPTPTTGSTIVEQPSGNTTVHAAGTQNANAYYGDPKVGVEVATKTPGLYPVFNGEPDLSGFAVDANTATGLAAPPGTTEPQPVCPPSISLTSNPAPNLYCLADPNGTYNFPMASTPANYGLAVSATPDGWYHSPDQTVPIADSIVSCQGAPEGSDGCAFDSLQAPTTADVTWFDYIGTFRSLVVKVTSSSGAALSGVEVTLTCTGPSGAPSFACPPSGEQNNLGRSGTTPQTQTGSTYTVTTGAGGEATFDGVYLPADQLHLAAAPPAGYQPGSLTTTVPSPVTASTTTSAAVSAAAQTPVVLPIVLAQTITTTTVAPTTTTTTVAPTTTTTTTTTTVVAPTTTITRPSLAFTGTDAESLAEDGAVILGIGGLLLLASRRQHRRGTHFKRR